MKEIYKNQETGLEVTRETNSDISDLCKKCDNYSYSVPANGGYCTHYCKKETYKNYALYSPYRDSYNNNTCKVIECNMFAAKYKLREENSELNILLNKFMEKGIYIEYKKTSDIESGTYYDFSGIDTKTGKRLFGGMPYNLEKALQIQLEKIIG